MEHMSKYLITVLVASFSFVSQANWQLVDPYNMNNDATKTIKKATNLIQINPTQQNDNTLISDKTSYLSNDIINLSYTFTNKSASDLASFDLSLSENNQFIIENTELSLKKTHELTFLDQQLTWQGLLIKPELNFTSSDNAFFGYIPLSDTFNIPARTCGATCINNIWPWNFNFTFQGEEVTRFYISKTGQLLFNGNVIGEGEPDNHNKANISPLYTPESDLESEVRLAQIKDTSTNEIYLIIEWTHLLNNQMQQRYQVIIKQHSSDIWFNYLDVLTTEPQTIASAQNTTGLVNFNILATSSNNLITDLPNQTNSTFKVTNKPGGQVILTTSVALAQVTLPALDEVYTTNEDQTLEIALPSDNLIATSTIAHTNSNLTNSGESPLINSFDVTLQDNSFISSKIIKQADNGNVALNNISESINLSYAPIADFYGQDDFSIEISDSYITTSPYTVNLTVLTVNDAPTITINSNIESSVKANTQVILTAQVTDIDSDDINITWQQISGPAVNYTLNDNATHLTFIAPAASEPTDILFEAQADDGDGKSSAQHIVTIEPTKSSSGSFSYFSFLLLMFTMRKSRN